MHTAVFDFFLAVISLNSSVGYFYSSFATTASQQCFSPRLYRDASISFLFLFLFSFFSFFLKKKKKTRVFNWHWTTKKIRVLLGKGGKMKTISLLAENPSKGFCWTLIFWNIFTWSIPRLGQKSRDLATIRPYNFWLGISVLNFTYTDFTFESKYL